MNAYPIFRWNGGFDSNNNPIGSAPQKRYLELLTSNGLPIDDKFIAKLWHKYLARGVVVYKDKINKKEQDRFMKLMKGHPNQMLAITINLDGETFTFKNDTQVLQEFYLAIGSLQEEWSNPSKHKKLFASKNHDFAVRISRLLAFLQYTFSENGVNISTRKLHILVYDLLALVFPNFFQEADPNEPKLDTDQIKAARIKSILKYPKVLKLK